jgi:hypothetical protein
MSFRSRGLLTVMSADRLPVADRYDLVFASQEHSAEVCGCDRVEQSRWIVAANGADLNLSGHTTEQARGGSTSPGPT